MADGFYFNTETHQVEEGRQSDYTKLMGPYPTREAARRPSRPRADATRRGTSRTRRADPQRRSRVATTGRWSLPPVAGRTSKSTTRHARPSTRTWSMGAASRLGADDGQVPRDASPASLRRVDARPEVAQPWVVERRVQVAGDDGAGRRSRTVSRDQRVSVAPRGHASNAPPGEIGCAATRTGESSGSVGSTRNEPKCVGQRRRRRRSHRGVHRRAGSCPTTAGMLPVPL